jgi:hypothetical protein
MPRCINEAQRSKVRVGGARKVFFAHPGFPDLLHPNFVLQPSIPPLLSCGRPENSCGDVPGFHLAQCSRSAIAGGQKQHGRCNKRRCDENPGADRAQRTSDGKDLASGPCIPPFGVKRTLDAPCFLGGGRHSYAVIRPRGSEALPSSSHEADGRRNNGHQTRPASSGGVLAAPTSLSRCFAMKTSYSKMSREPDRYPCLA